MYRRLLAVTAAALTAASCQSEAAHAPTTTSTPSSSTQAPIPDTQLWSTRPTGEDYRWEVLRRLRAIDSCALLPRPELAQHGQVNAVGPSTRLPTSCQAAITAPTGTPLLIDWSLQTGPMEGTPLPETRRVGGTVISVQPDEPDSDPHAVLECQVVAQFPSEVVVFVDVEAAAPIDTCAVGNQAVDTVVSRLEQEPPHGTSPDSVRTALTGADPCAVLPALDLDPAPPSEQHVQMCASRGDELVITYGHQHEGDIIQGDQTLTLDGRKIYVSEFDGFHIYEYAVGPLLSPHIGDEGPILPTATVTGRDKETVERAMRALFTTVG